MAQPKGLGLALRPWREVAEMFAARSGKRLTVPGVRCVAKRAERKIRKALVAGPAKRRLSQGVLFGAAV